VPEVELCINSPLSHRMSAKKAGKLILTEEIAQGETLGDLLHRLESTDPAAWQNIFDVQKNQIQTVIVTFLNNTILPRAAAPQAPLSDGDHITFILMYAGG